jgi:hypothetical protein
LDILDNLSLGLNPFGGGASFDALVAGVIDGIGEPQERSANQEARNEQ